MPFIPVDIEREATITSQVVSLDRGLIQLSGVKGRYTEDDEPFAAIACDLPAPVRSGMTKAEQERRDVEAFCTNILASTLGALSGLEGGPDANEPPDQVAHFTSRSVTIETAQLLWPEVVGAPNTLGRWDLFEKLRERLIRESATLASPLRQHRDHVVYVWFGTAKSPPTLRLPPRSVDDMVALLRQATPPPQLTVPAREGLPTRVPDGVVQRNEAQNIGVTWGPLALGYQSAMTVALGFELALAYSTSVTLTDVREELRRLCRQHDDPRNDVLLIAANASTRSGLYFPSSQLIADMIFDYAEPRALLNAGRPQHTRCVVVHDPANAGRHRVLHGDLP